MIAVERNVYWRPVDDPGLEYLNLTFGPNGGHALGLILRKLGEAHLRCRYEIDLDTDWRVQRFSLSVSDTESAPKRIALESNSPGMWIENGNNRNDLDGCLDIDIQVSAFTNTLPIRRLGLNTGDQAEIRVVYLPVPALEALPAAQRYTRLEPLGQTGNRYRYEGIFRDFTAELPVDADGLVTDYPTLFERVWPL